MTTKEEVMEKYINQLNELGVDIDDDLLEFAFSAVGPANYKADAQLVACSDDEELKRVFKGFVGDELEETDEEKGMSAIKDVCEQMKGSSRKYRAVFYYLLAKAYGK